MSYCFSAPMAGRVCAVISISAIVAGCASLDVQSNYKPPRNDAIQNSIVVQKPFDQAWDSFVRKLSQSFFVVNTISKESRLISITVKGPRANAYFDCGRLNSTVNGQQWAYAPGESARYHYDSFPTETTIQHNVSSRGSRMNIFIAPEGSGTVFEVNSTYSVTMKQNGQSVVKNVFGQVRGRDYLPASTATFSFTTRTYDTQLFGNTEVTCQATGEWEREILSLASS
jgi:hypothetical protein